MSPGKLQLWSYNYAPEPTGIAPVSTMLARELAALGWDVDVVAAHPHYPEPRWGTRLRPYKQVCDGIRVTRLPLWIGRDSAAQRLRQEASFASALLAATPFLGRPDVVLAVSPSFPALLPAIVNSKLKRLPLALWLHDLLPEGASSTGLVAEDGLVMRASRRLERAAYEAADRIVVLSAPWVDNLRDKGVPAEKLELILDPATRGMPEGLPAQEERSPRALCMGNIGYSQGLAPLVRAFERSGEIEEAGIRLVITGNGVAAEDVRAEIRSGRVEMPGLVDDARLERELRTAMLAVVSQAHEGSEFNLPSKLMNYMAYGLPIVAAVNPSSEAARLVREAGAGWVADSSDPDAFPRAVAAAARDAAELRRRSAASRAYAVEHFSPRGFAGQFDRVLADLARR
jgi:colanic acid biosynthesis glycosyl transferase WcaI